MVVGLPAEDEPRACIRIGYCNTIHLPNSEPPAVGVAQTDEEEDAVLEEYLSVFDAVVTGDGSFDFVLQVLEELVSGAVLDQLATASASGGGGSARI